MAIDAPLSSLFGVVCAASSRFASSLASRAMRMS